MALKKICFVVAEPMTAKAFLVEHLRALSDHYEITLIANFSNEQLGQPIDGVSRFVSVPIRRQISPLFDLYALALLFVLFRKEGFSSVHSVTPKAGLLAMVAAWFAGIEARFHVFTGQVWVGKTGVFRFILKWLDGLIFCCATEVLVDSSSQRDFLIANGVVTADKSTVLGYGSVCGVNLNRFKPSPEARAAVRKGLGLSDSDFVFLYLGRVNRDKGIQHLIRAFSGLGYQEHSAYLMIVGPEEDDVLVADQELLSRLGSHFVRVGFTPEPQNYMAAADVFCLPSYREGFGSVIIEAAAVGVPSIGSRIYGVTDAIEDEVSGLLHNLKDDIDLASKMQMLMLNRDHCRRLGRSALERARVKFSGEAVVSEMVRFYRARV